MYGVAVVLLPPVFTALVDRLGELDALRNATLFAPRKLSSADEDEMHKLQRHLFAKDEAPKKKDGWPAWGMANTFSISGVVASRGGLRHTIVF